MEQDIQSRDVKINGEDYMNSYPAVHVKLDDIFRIHDWVVFHGLKRSLKYNNKIGIIIALVKEKATVQLLSSKDKLIVSTKNLHHLKLHFSYTKDGKIPHYQQKSNLEGGKSSKYPKLVNFLHNLFWIQESSPILIGDNSKQNFDSIKYWTIPGINAYGQMFIRMPDSCLIESLLTRDINALVEVVNHQNHYMQNIVSNFREQLMTLLNNIFPSCKIVEAGSSSRRTNAMPISDLDIVCAISSNTDDDIQTFEEFLFKLIPAIKQHHPQWNIKRKEVALGVESCVNTLSNEGEMQLPTKLYADIVFKPFSERDAFAVATKKTTILNGLPSWALDAARIIKVILKCKIWPNAESRPPSYMVDVVIKYFYENGIPMICNRQSDDPRPYIKTERDCFMFWKVFKSEDGKDNFCIECQKLVANNYWECPRCDTVVCSANCKKLVQRQLDKRNRILIEQHPFPEKAFHSFSAVPASRHAEFNNRQWIDPVNWRQEHKVGSTYNFIIAFFQFGAYFDKMLVVFKKKAIDGRTRYPYIQDPANLKRNVVERFNPKSFIYFCHTFVDDSSKGVYEREELLELRESFYKPFNSIFYLGSKITIFLVMNESTIECLVDPRWSFKRLLGMHQATDMTEVPDAVFWYHSRACFIDHRGLVPDPSVTMISRGISFGHFIHLSDIKFVSTMEEPDEIKRQNVLNPNKFIPVSKVDDDETYDEIRTPRYQWGHEMPSHPKILIDKETGAMCYFSPSINVVRGLGPDFDFNPMNYPNLPECSNYKPFMTYTKYTKSLILGKMSYSYS